MKKSDLIAIAWQNLKNRKTRTILTICGVVVGACAIIIMLSIGLGIDKMITDQYKSDSKLTKISVYSSDDENGKPLPFDDSAVKYFEKIDGVKSVVPLFMVDSNASITCGKYRYTGTIYGIDLSQMEALGYKLKSGDFSGVNNPNCAFFGKDSVTNFQDAQGNQVNYSYDKNYEVSSCDIDAMEDSFLISSKSGDDGFGMDSTAKYGNKQKLEVSGVLKPSSSSDYDSQYSVFISMDLAKRLFEESQMMSSSARKDKLTYSSISVYVDDSSKVKDVKTTLQNAGYSCSTDDEALESSKKVMKVVQLVLGAIGAVSMFVASFGISNTMVMSVFERQKEIGILKVIGCEIKDIKAMFLYEAAIIGGIGGAIAVVISYIVSISANLIGRAVMNHMGGGSFLGMGADAKVTLSYIPPWLAICGVVISAGIGILAGLSPAKKSVKVSALTAIQN